MICILSTLPWCKLAPGDGESREMCEIFQQEEEQGHDGPAAALFTPGLWVIFPPRELSLLFRGRLQSPEAIPSININCGRAVETAVFGRSQLSEALGEFLDGLFLT